MKRVSFSFNMEYWAVANDEKKLGNSPLEIFQFSHHTDVATSHLRVSYLPEFTTLFIIYPTTWIPCRWALWADEITLTTDNDNIYDKLLMISACRQCLDFSWRFKMKNSMSISTRLAFFIFLSILLIAVKRIQLNFLLPVCCCPEINNFTNFHLPSPSIWDDETTCVRVCCSTGKLYTMG